MDAVTESYMLLRAPEEPLPEAATEARLYLQASTADQPTAVIDEIQSYQDMRWIASSESAWRLFEFMLCHQQPATTRLDLHLPGQQNITYNQNKDLYEVIEAAKSHITKLMAYFQLNVHDSNARQYLYHDIPAHYVFHIDTASWQPRLRGTAIGRMYASHPGEGERYYMRVLLTHVAGATSFDDLMTVDGEKQRTFRQACVARGLLQDDTEWHNCLTEAAVEQNPRSLRKLFVVILTMCSPGEPAVLWDKHKRDLCDDFMYRRGETDQTEPSTPAQRAALLDIAVKLQGATPARTLADFGLAMPGTPPPAATPPQPLPHHINLTEQHETEYDAPQLQQHLLEDESKLTQEQRHVYQDLAAAMQDYIAWRDKANPASHRPNQARCFFLHSVGGGGKTFLQNMLLARARLQHTGLATAATGVAAQLLEGGRTTHSVFRLSLKPSDNLTSNLGKLTDMAQHIQTSVVLVEVDEATMLHKHLIRQLDITLRDLLDKPGTPFAGMPIIFSGDFGQTLPVIKHASTEAQADAAMCYADVWARMRHVQLTKNMRIERARVAGQDVQRLQQFNDFLLMLRDGSIGHTFKVPDQMLLPPTQRTLDALVEFVWGDITRDLDADLLMKRALLTPLNEHVDQLTDQLTALLPGDATTYISADSHTGDYDAGLYSTEILNTLEAPGIPRHRLVLKEGMPVMVMRNINGIMGLVNGTRLQIKKCLQHSIYCLILTGRRRKEHIFLPRMAIDTDDDDLPVQFRRLQLAVRPCLVMTLNKSQGQNMERVGIYLPVPVFAQGQLYVGCSRVDDSQDIRVLITHAELPATPSTAPPGEHTINVVDQKVLQAVDDAIRASLQQHQQQP